MKEILFLFGHWVIKRARIFSPICRDNEKSALRCPP